MPKYAEKRDTPFGVRYVYSEEALAKRNKKKAKRYRRINHNGDGIRATLLADANAGSLPALAAVLCAVTYERPGNPTSAANGHLGVTGWTKKEVKITGNKALIKYVGKSGTAQFKVVNNPTVIRLLKRQIAATATGPIVPVRQAALNAYLDQFGITAKDLRGFGANEEMKNATRLLRRKGPSLNSLSEGKRKSQLKREWLTALAYVAEKVGHSKAILRKQYLVPGMEERWLNQ